MEPLGMIDADASSAAGRMEAIRRFGAAAAAALLVVAGLALVTAGSASAQNASVCSGTAAVGSATSSGLVDDCDTLMGLKSTLTGSSGSLNWATGTAISSWDGITVVDGRVSKIELANQSPKLNGTIPAGLGSLPQLVTLDLSDNSLTGSAPAALVDASWLTNINLSNNSLTGCYPARYGLWESNSDDFTFSINPQSGGSLTRCTGVWVAGSQLGVKEGSSSAYGVNLSTQPTSDVTVTLAATGTISVDTDRAQAGNQDTLAFTPTNWGIPQTVIVTAQRGKFGTATITHTAASTDTNYSGPGPTVTVSITAILSAPTSLAGTWNGTTLNASWQALGAGTLEFQLLHRVSTGADTWGSWIDTGWVRHSLTRAITGLDSTKTYQLVVRSRDLASGHYGAWSAPVTVTP